MNQISLTIPMEYIALTRAADMLKGIAADLPGTVQETTPTIPVEEIPTAPKLLEVVNNTPSADEPSPSSSEGVDVDSDGLPWDARIHASSKAILAKTQQWKKKRGVEAEFVAEVEAELRAAMAVPTPPPVTTSAPTLPPVTTPVPTPPLVTTPASTAAQPDSGITTLPELMKAATGAGKTPEEMIAAANKVGLASVPLLGARPDLIPTVAAELGLGG